MAHLVPVADPRDPRLRDYVRLTDVQLRKTLEVDEGLFIAEGEKVVRRAVETGHRVRSLLMAAKWVEPLSDLLDRVDAPVYVVDDATAQTVTGYAVHRGALASMARLPLPSVPEMLAGAGRPAAEPGETASGRAAAPLRRILVLEDLADHGNVGAIFRCAAALGIEAIVLSPRCADPLYRRSVKVSMGAVFAIPYARMTNWHDGLADLRESGFQLLALTPDQSAVPMDKVAMGERVALMLGSEGDGLSSRWLHEADEPVCIPMSAGAMALGVDSLNVVAAAAIACHGLMTH
ncbi:TrmH family RNA methyltransferase [Actinomadura scrupuli]|uniref:TrmH family RNA methyltransferase n=1 Tax=Actinomadura scrupuli TaxID=559629 RepID=UPI003D9852F1